MSENTIDPAHADCVPRSVFELASQSLLARAEKAEAERDEARADRDDFARQLANMRAEAVCYHEALEAISAAFPVGEYPGAPAGSMARAALADD